MNVDPPFRKFRHESPVVLPKSVQGLLELGLVRQEGQADVVGTWQWHAIRCQPRTPTPGSEGARPRERDGDQGATS